MTHHPGTVAVFAPQRESRPKSGSLLTPRQLVAALFRFYRTPGSRLALIITSVLLCYGGGLLMFWFHAVALGEGGPNISWYAHWLLDSTFGFIGLTPVVFVALPLASWLAQRVAGPGQSPLTWVFVGTITALFSVATIPGPIAHDRIVGRGTWMAAQVTQAIGNPSAPPHPRHVYPMFADLTQQLGAAVPIYLAMTTLSLLVVRQIMAVRHRDAEV
jgi:hypothetical protein